MGRRPSPIDVDDLLAEILLRLPALPCSLPRASLVCSRWRRLFLRRFRAHHWKPLGGCGGNDYTWEFRGCRNGRVLLISRSRCRYGLRQVLVWNPVAGEHHLIGTPHVSDPNWDRYLSSLSGAVICASGDKGPFKVALAWNGSRSAQVCVYSSETGVWGDVVSAPVQSESSFAVSSRNVLVGNSLYWFLFGSQLHILI
ncbi:hypothetical protein C2845_PM05G06470 [Panicum miliaceum]|uniref:F-box domain-containing protein n=1 Tax=Panicum miliaceum TaxID=4540 RepID=A0A3L6T4C8_PANMI|nr:hypothetical protein C2845_PM05G06470 [Panicum miliaceum]